MKLKRTWVTPYIVFTFLVTAVTGFFMLFHILYEYLEILHELAGLAFIVFSAFHIALNWGALKLHFPKRPFIVSGIVILTFSILLIILGKSHTGNNYNGNERYNSEQNKLAEE